VPSPPHTLTINIGDLLARWTNDRWRATMHRVAAPPTSQAAASGRLSIVYFTGPAPETVVACLPCAKCTQGAAKYAPITAEQHVTEKMRAATAHATPTPPVE
jgi:isopenicillin N synthase-like dioxygenase